MEVFKRRRSYYNLGKNLPVPIKEVENLLKTILYYGPSYYNSQSTKIVLLTEKSHEMFWETIVKEVLRKEVNDSEKFKRTNAKIDKFKKAYGTILFFEDMDILKATKAKFPLYEKQFDDWAIETNAMHQLMTWIGLRDLGIGASLQHYNPIIDERVEILYSIPDSWRLIAQMPFGEILTEEPMKPKKEINERFLHLK